MKDSSKIQILLVDDERLIRSVMASDDPIVDIGEIFCDQIEQ